MFCSCRAAVRGWCKSFARQNGPRPVQHGGGVESDISASRLESTDDRSKRCSCHKRDLGAPEWPPACPAWGGVELVAVLHSIRTAFLADDAILLACHSCHCLRDSVDDFIRFIGIDFVRACCRRYSAKKSSISSTIMQWRQGRSSSCCWDMNHLRFDLDQCAACECRTMEAYLNV
jgi:hypothetical protein